jgi:hypothetical protein
MPGNAAKCSLAACKHKALGSQRACKHASNPTKGFSYTSTNNRLSTSSCSLASRLSALLEVSGGMQLTSRQGTPCGTMLLLYHHYDFITAVLYIKPKSPGKH